MLAAPSSSETLPAAARVLVGASLRLLVRADEAAVRVTGATERLRMSLPVPRRPYDDL